MMFTYHHQVMVLTTSYHQISICQAMINIADAGRLGEGEDAGGHWGRTVVGAPKLVFSRCVR